MKEGKTEERELKEKRQTERKCHAWDEENIPWLEPSFYPDSVGKQWKSAEVWMVDVQHR